MLFNQYEPDLELHGDEHVDMLIENVLQLILTQDYKAEGFDKAYTDIVRGHINPYCPALMAGHAGSDRINIGAVHYLVMLKLDFVVICKGGSEWPPGGFDYLPDATTAVAIHYPNSDRQTQYTPGVSINQAALASIIQYARELSIAHHNQLELPLHS